jgi:hypothetical protein
MEYINMVAKKTKLFELMSNGKEYTAKQIKTRFKFANLNSVYDTIYDLRNEGHRIYLNAGKNSKGEAINKYRMAV